MGNNEHEKSTGSAENVQQYSDLCTVIRKLDTISEHIFGQVQDMLGTFENKMLSKMDAHLDRYEKRMTETTREFSEEMKKHSEILKKHELDIYSIQGKTDAIRQQITDMETNKEKICVQSKLWDVVPKRWVVIAAIFISTILAIDIIALIYAVGKIMEVAQK